MAASALQQTSADKVKNELLPRKRKDGSWEVFISGKGGSIPNSLSGIYTTQSGTVTAIKLFQAAVQAKVGNKK